MKPVQNKYLLKKRLEVLRLAKLFINDHEIKTDILSDITKKYNLKENEINILFPEGNKDIIKFALDQLNQNLENYCKSLELIRLPLHKRIRKILLSKILIMNKEKKFYKKIFFNFLIPNKEFYLPKQLYKSVDQIWFIAGDNSIDFNFYSKRLILAGIYTRILIFFFNNNDQIKLEKILDDSLKRVAKIPEIKSKINIFKNNLPNIFKLIKNFN